MAVGADTSIWESLARVASLVLAAACSVTDVRTRRIPNALTLPAILAGLAIGSAAEGWKGLGIALLGMAVGSALLLLPYLLDAMGAGDVKMMAAMGALLGFPAVIQVFLYTCMAGGIMAVALIAHRKAGRRAFQNMYGMFLGLLPFVKGFTPKLARENSVGAMPYGIAIGLGTLAYCVLGKVV